HPSEPFPADAPIEAGEGAAQLRCAASEPDSLAHTSPLVDPEFRGSREKPEAWVAEFRVNTSERRRNLLACALPVSGLAFLGAEAETSDELLSCMSAAGSGSHHRMASYVALDRGTCEERVTFSVATP